MLISRIEGIYFAAPLALARPARVEENGKGNGMRRAPWLARHRDALVSIMTRGGTNLTPDYSAMLAAALAEARKGLAEGGIPIGAAIFDHAGGLVGSGHNRRVQNGDPSMHGETDAFRNAGRQRSYRNLIMVTTLAPCWYCSGLVRQFGFGTLVVGESRNFQGGLEWLRSLGVTVIDLDSEECVSLLADYIRDSPEVWNEDIGKE
jgi:cytosine/creatinine deaminase